MIPSISIELDLVVDKAPHVHPVSERPQHLQQYFGSLLPYLYFQLLLVLTVQVVYELVEELGFDCVALALGFLVCCQEYMEKYHQPGVDIRWEVLSKHVNVIDG